MYHIADIEGKNISVLCLQTFASGVIITLVQLLTPYEHLLNLRPLRLSFSDGKEQLHCSAQEVATFFSYEILCGINLHLGQPMKAELDVYRY